ncbi:MAG: hypothetical protein KUG68_03130, partial [Flavobacteriaceae bacterium]|nr:hypothetical protein [Flavobacteriaceae bacterium]
MKHFYIFFLFIFISNANLISQNVDFNEYHIEIIDSLINKQLDYQKQHRELNTLVFLKDSIYSYYYDDVGEE